MHRWITTIAVAVVAELFVLHVAPAAAQAPPAPIPGDSVTAPPAASSPPVAPASIPAAASPVATPVSVVAAPAPAPVVAVPAATPSSTPAVQSITTPTAATREAPATAAMTGFVPNAKPAVSPALSEVPSWLKGITLGAGALLWWYQPIVPSTFAPGTENNVSVFWARLLVDGKWDVFGFHLEPRFRDTPLRTISTKVDGTTLVTYAQDDHAYLQEAYALADINPIGAHLKLGKEYSHLGFFWDNSFYGNVQVYDGLKLDPDYGASLEGDVGKKDDTLSLGWWAQYFIVDGTTNVSLPGRDTISVPGARRRNQTIARLEPRINAGPVNIALGASGEYLEADLPTIGPQNVWRAAGDATVAFAGLKLLGEVQHQDGRHVTDFPFASTAAGPGSSKNISYAQVGGDYTLGPVTARYYVSLGIYNDAPMPTGGTATVKEWLHVPALAFAVSPNISLLAELVFWQHNTPTTSSLNDRSFNLTLYAHL
jgi:hypothetical protein